jgi:glutamine amidotransferase
MGHPNLYAAVFRDTAPAWNNANLRELCIATRSKCILAHVRAASRFASVSQENCHPFKAGRLLFCHNGRIDQFPKLKRALLARLTEDAFMKVKGTTDSECMFALALTFLQEDGTTDVSPFNQDTPFGHKRLVNAIKKTLVSISCGLRNEQSAIAAVD